MADIPYNSPMRPAPRQDDGDDIKKLVAFAWRLRWWIAACAAFALMCAYMVSRYSTRIYSRKESVLLLNSKQAGGAGSAQMSMLQELAGFGGNTVAENEAFILRTPALLSKAVEEIGANYRYYASRPIWKSRLVEMYGAHPCDLVLEFDELYPDDALPKSLSLRIAPVDGGYKLKSAKIGKDEPADILGRHSFGEKLSYGGVTFSVVENKSEDFDGAHDYVLSWSTPFVTATGFAKNLTVTNTMGAKSAKTDIIELTLLDNCPKRAEELLEMLVVKYNEDARDSKNETFRRTVEFIDSRLAELSEDLGKVESEYRNYQSSNTLVDLAAQSQLALGSDAQYDEQLNEVRVQQTILKMLQDDIKAGRDEYRVIPSNIGVTDNGLNQVIANYNTLVAERNRLVANASETNPRVLSINEQLKDSRQAIELTIDNLSKVYKIKENDLTSVIGRSKRKISALPSKQLDLAQISRRQDIIEPLYVLLQQKKEETRIAMSSTEDNVRVIEPAYGSPLPVAPNTKMFYIIALMLGCCLPLGVMWLVGMFKNKIETKEDVKKVLGESVPVIATLPHAEEGTVVTMQGRDTASESFRMLRTNLQYLRDSKVFAVTSSIPGEGKSHVASNLARSISHTGKKVAVVGLDLRKPTLPKFFPEVPNSSAKSVVAWLIGKLGSPAEIAEVHPHQPNLHIFFAGAVPPNPTELLDSLKLAELIDWLRAEYDYVICDCTPYLPVPDASLVCHQSDAVLYVARAEFTQLSFLKEIKQMHEEGSLKGAKLVLNDFSGTSYKYKYGYGYGYGSAAGYGYGSGYGYGYGSSAGSEGSRKRK